MTDLNPTDVLRTAKATAMTATRRVKSMEGFRVVLPGHIVATIDAIRSAVGIPATGYRLPDVSRVGVDEVEEAVTAFAQDIVTAEYGDRARAGVITALVRRLNAEVSEFLPEAIAQATPRFNEAVAAYKEAVRLLPDGGFTPRSLAQQGWQVVKAWEDAVEAQTVLLAYAKWISRDVLQESGESGEQWRVLVDTDAAPDAHGVLASTSQTMMGDDKMNIGLYFAAKNDFPFRLMA